MVARRNDEECRVRAYPSLSLAGKTKHGFGKMVHNIPGLFQPGNIHCHDSRGRVVLELFCAWTGFWDALAQFFIRSALGDCGTFWEGNFLWRSALFFCDPLPDQRGRCLDNAYSYPQSAGPALTGYFLATNKGGRSMVIRAGHEAGPCGRDGSLEANH